MLNALPQLETVTAFFFGNGFPLQMDCQFFIACNGRTFMHVKEQFLSLYEFRSQPESRPYWNRYEGSSKTLRTFLFSRETVRAGEAVIGRVRECHVTSQSGNPDDLAVQ